MKINNSTIIVFTFLFYFPVVLISSCKKNKNSNSNEPPRVSFTYIATGGNLLIYNCNGNQTAIKNFGSKYYLNAGLDYVQSNLNDSTSILMSKNTSIYFVLNNKLYTSTSDRIINYSFENGVCNGTFSGTVKYSNTDSIKITQGVIVNIAQL